MVAESGECQPGPDYLAMAIPEAVGTTREAPAFDLTSTQHIRPHFYTTHRTCTQHIGASHEVDESRDPATNSLAWEPITVITKWKNDQETSILLERLVNGGRIRKSAGATHWELISQEIKKRLGVRRTPDECRRRYDSLLKAYKQVEKTGKSLDITDKELKGLNLRTRLTVDWFRAIYTYDQRKSGTAQSRKRAKRSPDGENDMPSGNPAPPPILSGSPAQEMPFGKQVAIPGFSSLREDLRLTFLNLIQVIVNCAASFNDSVGILDLEEVCRMLAIVEDQKPWEIRKKMYELSELKLVDLRRGDGKAGHLETDSLRVFKKFVAKVLCKNPDFNFFLTLSSDDDIVSISGEPASLSLQHIRVLIMHGCSEIEKVDMSCFPELRFLLIRYCDKLRVLTGWEVVTKLGWLEILGCGSYEDFPPVQYLSCLRECTVGSDRVSTLGTKSVPDDFRQCVGLRRLRIWHNESSALNKMDLSTLRFLEVLDFYDCGALTSIQGLSGLHSLTRLDLSRSRALKRVPELGCLKALTHLDMRWSGVEEIPGVEDLVSLESLDCNYSELQWLPDLHHLPHLQEVCIEGTPLSEMESSSFYFGKEEVCSGSSNVEGKVLLTEISDISDTELVDSHNNYS